MCIELYTAKIFQLTGFSYFKVKFCIEEKKQQQKKNNDFNF